jgi:hypothetical protein
MPQCIMAIKFPLHPILVYEVSNLKFTAQL